MTYFIVLINKYWDTEG